MVRGVEGVCITRNKVRITSMLKLIFAYKFHDKHVYRQHVCIFKSSGWDYTHTQLLTLTSVSFL